MVITKYNIFGVILLLLAISFIASIGDSYFSHIYMYASVLFLIVLPSIFFIFLKPSKKIKTPKLINHVLIMLSIASIFLIFTLFLWFSQRAAEGEGERWFIGLTAFFSLIISFILYITSFVFLIIFHIKYKGHFINKAVDNNKIEI